MSTNKETVKTYTVSNDPVKPKRTLVKWEDEHRLKVAAKYIEICLRHHLDPHKHHGMSKTFMEAQQILPHSLHRPIASITGSKNQVSIMEFVDRLLERETIDRDEQMREAAQKASRAHNTVSDQARATESDIGSGLSNPQPKFVPRKVEREPITEPSNIEDMIQTFAQGIAHIVVGEVVKQLKTEFLREFPKLATRALTVSKTLPKILVVGPLNKQQSILEAAVDGVAELKFVSSEEQPSLVAMRGKSCVAAVIWTNFVSHSHSDAVKKLFNDHNSRLVKGGLDTVKAVLEEISIQISEPA